MTRWSARARPQTAANQHSRQGWHCPCSK